MPALSIVDYSRQADIDEELEFFRIKNSANNVIVGCGGVGFWVAIFLALMGVSILTLIEGDRIETSNLNRLPFPQGWVGKHKAIALRRLLWLIRPEMIITVIQKPLTERTIPMFIGPGHIWDCTDDARIQTKIYKRAKDIGSPYTKIGYERFGIGNYADYDLWIEEETYSPGYRTSSANAITSAISAGIGIFSACLRAKGESIGDVNLKLDELIRKAGSNEVV